MNSTTRLSTTRTNLSSSGCVVKCMLVVAFSSVSRAVIYCCASQDLPICTCIWGNNCFCFPYLFGAGTKHVWELVGPTGTTGARPTAAPGKIGKIARGLKGPCPCLLIAATLQHTMAPGGRFEMMCKIVGPTDSTTVDHVASSRGSTSSSKIDSSAFVQLSMAVSQAQPASICPLISTYFASSLMYWNMKLST
jgi:hypothetical protein